MNLAILLPVYLVEIFITHNFWYSALERRHSKLKSNIIYFTIQILNIIKCLIIYEHISLKAFTSQIVSMFLISYLFKDKWYKKVAVYTSYMVCVMFAEFFVSLFAAYIFPHNELHTLSSSYPCFLCIIIVNIFIFIFTTIALLLLKNKNIRPESKVTQCIFLYISIQCLLIFIVSMLMHEYKVTSPTLIFVTGIIFAVSVIIVFMLAKSMKYVTIQSAEAEFFKKEAEIKDKHFSELKEQYMEYKKLRHDFYNHIKVIEQLNDRENLKTYVSEIKENLDSLEQITYCNNPTLDALLSIKKSEAVQAGINTSHEICDTDRLTISDYDLCTIISNLLDNAIRAASKTEKKFIILQITIKMERLIITVRNSSLPVLPDLKTTKNDKENHGLGLKNITSIAEKYDGTTLFNYENEEFVSIVNLKN